ncbi:MAG TPA: hypothetical protein VJV79_14125 [Polyangiaceae bacterium]|nr:hypothetical protein [Polyangiaceae bacterium]
MPDGFALNPARRECSPIEPDARGDLLVPPLGLKLGLRTTRFRNYDQPFVRWLDLEGNALLLPQERAEQEPARADEAMRRVAELERRFGAWEPKASRAAYREPAAASSSRPRRRFPPSVSGT